MAEFVAQEEMDRSTGYWWAPDERHVAFVRIDESPVKVAQRFEIAADNVETSRSDPAAGGPNVPHPPRRQRRAVGRGDLDRFREEQDIYLARVTGCPTARPRDPARKPRSAPAGFAFRRIDTGESRLSNTPNSTSR